MGCGGGVWTSVVLGCYLVMVVRQWFMDLLVVHGCVCETLRSENEQERERERERYEIPINKYKHKEISKNIHIHNNNNCVYLHSYCGHLLLYPYAILQRLVWVLYGSKFFTKIF